MIVVETTKTSVVKPASEGQAGGVRRAASAALLPLKVQRSTSGVVS